MKWRNEEMPAITLLTQLTPEEAAQQVILHLESEGYVGAEGTS
jgi:hypothetical protein